MTVSDDTKKQILNLLQGYITCTEREENTDLTEIEYNNVITEEELELFYANALNQCLNYCNLVNFPIQSELNENDEVIVKMDDLFRNSVILYCAGLIWRKYDIRANDQIEETGGYVISYGDQLIIDAKKELAPFIYQKVVFW